jgi:hypothetical protein
MPEPSAPRRNDIRRGAQAGETSRYRVVMWMSPK